MQSRWSTRSSRLQRTDEVTVEYRRLSNQVTQVSRGIIVEETEFQLPRITEDRRGHSTEEGGVQSGHTRSGEVRVQSRKRSSSSWITEDR